jgi:hypothetical protein
LPWLRFTQHGSVVVPFVVPFAVPSAVFAATVGAGTGTAAEAGFALAVVELAAVAEACIGAARERDNS